jgi:hypothetical protein
MLDAGHDSGQHAGHNAVQNEDIRMPTRDTLFSFTGLRTLRSTTRSLALAAFALVAGNALATSDISPQLAAAPVVMGQAGSDQGGSQGGSQGASQTAPVQPAEPAPGEDLTKLSGGTVAFGTSGSTWWGVGGGAAFGFGDVDGKGYVTISHFLADDLELTGEVAGWYLSLHNDNAIEDDDGSTGGGSISGILRYHFVNTGEWTVFVDGGIGVLFSGDDVPTEGSAFNFLPRVGMGFTASITDATRLLVGASWHHISNADMNGDDDNPGRDGVMVYAGLIFAF